MLNTKKLSGNVDGQLMKRIQGMECRLARIVNFVAYTLAGQKFTSNQIEREEESMDAELSKRVFSLSHSLHYRLNGVGVGSLTNG